MTPAGVVTVVDATDWKMTGDNSDNALEIDVTDDFIVVTPLNGTRLKVNGFTYDPDEPVEFDGPPTVLLGSGNDQLLASDVGVTGKSSIDAGAGNDRCLLNSIALNRTSTVNLQAGNDALSIVSPTLTAGAKLDLIGGTNTDIVQGDTATTGVKVKQFETVDTTNNNLFDEIRDSVFAKLDEARNGFWM